MESPHYELIKGGTHGRLLEDYTFKGSVTGYRVSFDRAAFRCELYPAGVLHILACSEWDFGSFAIDTPAMVIGSLEHDAICLMTDHGQLPWSCRSEGDKQLWKRLTENGATISRLWRVPAVMGYSQLVARWKREPYKLDKKQ